MQQPNNSNDRIKPMSTQLHGKTFLTAGKEVPSVISADLAGKTCRTADGKTVPFDEVRDAAT